MAGEIQVGSLSASRGQKMSGTQTLNLDGHSTELPVFIINGNADGPTLAVTGGVHGAEYASIEAALRLGRTLEPEQLRGRVIVVPVVDMPSFKARSIYICPLDGRNPNRFFPGNPKGTASEQLDDWLYQNVIKQGNYFVDLHGGDLNEALVPFTLFQKFGNKELDQKSLEMARVFGIRYLVSSEVKGSTTSAAAMAGVPGILAESGGQGVWHEEHIARHTMGLSRLMRHLGMIEGPSPDPLPTKRWISSFGFAANTTAIIIPSHRSATWCAKVRIWAALPIFEAIRSRPSPRPWMEPSSSSSHPSP